MRLYYTPTSPYARKALIVAIETGLDERIERVTADPWASKNEAAQYNPLGKVPTLETDNGELLFDSPVVCEYLDSLHDGPRLFPVEGPARWQALRTQALGDGILDATVLTRLESMRAAEQRSEKWTARLLAAIQRSLKALEDDPESLAGTPSIGLVSVGCALGYLDFRLSSANWRASHPRLTEWFETWSRRPAMRATEPPKD